MSADRVDRSLIDANRLAKCYPSHRKSFRATLRLCFHWANLPAEHSFQVFVYRPTFTSLNVTSVFTVKFNAEFKPVTQKIQITKARNFQKFWETKTL